MITIKSILIKYFVKYALLPIILIEVSLLLLYFGINYYISKETSNKMKEEYLKNGKDLLGKESKRIEQMLLEIKNTTTIMQKEHEQILSNPKNYNVVNKPNFTVAPNGAYYKTTKTGSSLYYSGDTKITKEERNKAILTEAMDPLLKNIVNINRNIVSAYFNSYDNMVRIYPYLENIYDIFGPTINLSEFNFYFLANKQNNPSRKPVWTEVYLDPAGNGWMFSCIAPIYKDDFLLGVSGLDITIDTLVSNILETKLPYNASMFLVDHNGMILAMPEAIEKLLNLNELKSHTYSDPVTHTITKPLEFNVFKNQNPFAKHFKKMIKNDKTIDELNFENKNYITLQHIVNESNWKLMIIIEEDKIFASINELKRFSNIIGFFAIFFMIIFYLIYFYILSKKSIRLSNSISEPLNELTEQTSQIRHSHTKIKPVDTNIAEIHHLTTNFANMAKELNTKTSELIETELQKQEKVKEAKHYMDKSLKDPLTSLCNRERINQMLEAFYENFKNQNKTYSVIFIDIDHFKTINDTFGHAKGDEVLKQLALVLKSITRENDIVGRYGGEEFLIIIENNIEIAKMIAQKIRKTVESTKFPISKSITCSLGIAMVNKNDTKGSVVERADKALYKAKENGRNQVVLF